MTNQQTREVLEVASPEDALRFHLMARHYPPVHPDFHPAIIRAVELARDGFWDEVLELPNGRSVTVASTIDQLHLDPFLE